MVWPLCSWEGEGPGNVVPQVGPISLPPAKKRLLQLGELTLTSSHLRITHETAIVTLNCVSFLIKPLTSSLNLGMY